MLIPITLDWMHVAFRRSQENWHGSFRLPVRLVHKALEDRPELFQGSGLPGGVAERAVLIQSRQSMDKRPGGDRTQLCELRRAFILLRETGNHSETGLCRALDVGIFRSIEARVKHHIEVIRMVSRKAQIRHSRLDNLVSKVDGLLNRPAYLALKNLISIAGDLREQCILIVEMTIRRGNRHTSEPRSLVQRKTSRASLSHQAKRRLLETRLQVPVVIFALRLAQDGSFFNGKGPPGTIVNVVYIGLWRGNPGLDRMNLVAVPMKRNPSGNL